MGRGANCTSRAKLSNLASMWSSPEEHDCERLLEGFQAGQWELLEDGVVHTVNMIYTHLIYHQREVLKVGFVLGLDKSKPASHFEQKV